ncbi:hypothetical protein NC653_001502 [Populus alba x Populus x berolinensis]|uniref:Uncharacterized protein n=1 Tax=Populus alba x Populus x berolinensis TaxID=444605 RepID=A0AAD6RLL8_9ROSI|nr:hypothetical protein NC653_001502 [Populus alba x Populus x berolinensis]
MLLHGEERQLSNILSVISSCSSEKGD